MATFICHLSTFHLSYHIILQIIQLALLLLVYYLFVGEGSLCLGVPVYHAQTAVDKPLVVEVYEHLDDACAALLVHGEGRTVPVA